SCLKKPDLFRRGGYHRDLQEIRWLLDNVESWNAESRISSVSAYSILEAIVLFFDCLPDSLFPSQLYSTIMDASKSFKNSLEIYNCLPEINANVFVYLITFLKLVHSHSSENDTDLPLFADTFADVLIKPPAALSLSQIPKSDRDSKRKFLGYFLANDVSHLFQIDLLLTRDEYPLLARHLEKWRIYTM
uniref:Rho-GAP domain-containing protein n=1 Tax=Macrostomum lignano TaxID=282301 RepID=A0A1I8GNS6_9PLAT